jgi:hypothetical protein
MDKAPRYHYLQTNPKAVESERLVGWDSVIARWVILEKDEDGNLREKSPASVPTA